MSTLDENITKLKELLKESRILSLEILQDKELDEYKQLYIGKLYELPTLLKKAEDKINNK